jgi:hypothetical protein
MMDARTNTRNPYVDFRMQEWGMDEQSRRMQTCVRNVLSELVAEATLLLKDPKLEVMVLPEAAHSVWAYFPVRGRDPNQEVMILPDVPLKPETQILLVFGVSRFRQETIIDFKSHLRDHLGHTLLYLRDPNARNECADAWKEWLDSIRCASKKLSHPSKIQKPPR